MNHRVHREHRGQNNIPVKRMNHRGQRNMAVKRKFFVLFVPSVVPGVAFR
jgi:hypothetical protein